MAMIGVSSPQQVIGLHGFEIYSWAASVRVKTISSINLFTLLYTYISELCQLK